MLILDKRKAIEQIVALTAHETEAEAEAALGSTHARARQRVAVYERSRAAMQEGNVAATRLRRAVRLATDGASP
jgi:hypothetical protein